MVPVRVTVKLLPCAPVLGAIEVSVGRVLATPWNSTAPTSMKFRFAGSGLVFPKKSVWGASAPPAELTEMALMAGDPAASE